MDDPSHEGSHQMNKSSLALGLLLMALASPGLAEWQFGAVARDSGVINLGGVPHPYMIEGKGETCLIVGPGSQYPPLLSDRLKQSLRFIYIDFKRTWTAPPEADISKVDLQTMVDEVEAVRQAFGIDRLCLVGHSTPVYIAVEYALQHPEHVSRLIMIGAPPYTNEATFRFQKEFWERDASPARKAKYAENLKRWPNSLLSTLTPYDDFSVRYTRADPYYFRDYNYDFTWIHLGRYFNAPLAIQFYRKTTATYDPRPRLAGNKIPILSIIGRYDYIMPPDLWDGYEKQVPSSTVVKLERSGHFPMIEEQDRFDDTILSWLKRTRGR